MTKPSPLSGEIGAIYDWMDLEVAASLARLEELREQADALRDEAFQHIDDAACAADDYHGERSEKWQEGEKGRAYSDWKDRLESLRDGLDSLPEIEPIDIVRPDFIGDLEAGDYEAPDGDF